MIIKTDMQKSFQDFANTKASSVLASPHVVATLLCDMQKEAEVNSAVFVRQFCLLLPSDHYLILFGSLFILRELLVTCG